MNWEMNLYDEYFQQIKSGRKTVEGRAPSEKRDYNDFKVGDTITFTNLKTGEQLEVVIEYVSHYPTVQEMLETEGLDNVLPKAGSIEEGVKAYYSIEDYEERIKKGGIYAIKIHLRR